MKIIIVLTSLLLLFSVSAAIQLMKEYVKDYPDPKALYFLGYAFYEQKDMKTAFKYFKDAYLINPEVSPMTWK
jgi:TolA-binding protein